jgi:uncharacterized membrane protein YedE/YeeE
MEFTIHQQVLLTVFAVAAIMGAVAQKTHFCTMGAVSDWVNMGDTGRMRAWLLAIAVAVGGVALLEGAGVVNIGTNTFPPYRTPNFAWLRYVVGGLMFGVGMTLGSGCGNKTLLRIGGGNLKSVVVLAIASLGAYAMIWTDFYGQVFHPWVNATTINLAALGVQSQALGDIIGGLAGLQSTRGLQLALAAGVCLGLLAFVFSSRDFRGNRDGILGGLVVGAAVLAGWYVTGGPMGRAWKEFTEMALEIPSRVEVQSFTFISPMGDTVRYLTQPGNFNLINFGVAALAGVMFGAFLHALVTRSFRIEWFVNGGDFANHAAGGALMGIGGVLSMGCTIGQGVTGVSTLALGSLITFVSIVAGAAATMKFQYWRLMREA